MKDILFEDDLPISHGDFIVIESDQQHIEHILVSQKGDYKEFPLVGVGITNYLYGNDTVNRLVLEKDINNQLQNDGFTPLFIDVTDLNNIQIDGKYI